MQIIVLKTRSLVIVRIYIPHPIMNIRVWIPVCFMPMYLLCGKKRKEREREGERGGGREEKEDEGEAGEMWEFCQLIDTTVCCNWQ